MHPGQSETNNSREHWACSDPREHVRGAWSVCSSGPAGYWDSIKRAFHLDKHSMHQKKNSRNTEQNISKYPLKFPKQYTYKFLFIHGRTLSFKSLGAVRCFFFFFLERTSLDFYSARTNYIDQKWHTHTHSYKHSQNLIKKCALIMWLIL